MKLSLGANSVLRSKKMLDRIASFSAENGLFEVGDRVLAAVSGGADSTAMLCILKSLEKKLCITLSAVHVNHNLRGSESKRDEEFCIALCKKLQVPIKTVSINVRDFCQKNAVSTEEGARILRYEVFDNEKSDKIATAHTLNDSYETALFNLARGTALRGICGIPVKRGKIVRPLLCVTRDEIERYLKDIGQSYVTDTTNLTDDYTRNYIRHNIVPKMLTVNQSALSNFENTSRALSADESYLDETAQKEYENAETDGGLDIKKLLKINRAIRNRVLVKALRTNEIQVSAKRIKDLERCIFDRRKVNLSGDVFCFVEDDILKIGTQKPVEWKTYEHKISIGEEVEFFGRTVRVEKVRDINIKFTKFSFDCDKIKGKLFVRNRKSGDKVKFYGQDHTKNLKKLFCEKIPLKDRMKTIILADDEGIVFVEGFGAAERVKTDEKTENKAVLVIS